MAWRLSSICALSLIALAACGDSPPPNVDGRDSGLFPDLGFLDDSGQRDAQVVDGGPRDIGVEIDSGIDIDGGTPVDSGTPVDGGPVDTGVDGGVGVPDQDGDNISDADEGNGQVDTDTDGTPDSQDSDSDSDGIPDSVEAGDANVSTPPIDTDTDGTPDFRDDDSDGDGILDSVEGAGDSDGDGVPDYRDTDSDGDGIGDATEGSGDSDGDGIPDFRDTDTDGDGIPDSIEGSGDPDNDGIPSYLDDDSDGDGILDSVEGTADPDRDQVPASLDTDSDGDGILDSIEGTADPDGDGTGNWLDSDSDGDTIRDAAEGVTDTDGDLTPNYLDTDADGDGIVDADEAGDANLNTPPIDSDFDTIPNYLDIDSDSDTISDGDEGSVDTDGNGLLDRLDIDSDGDSLLDIVEAGDADLGTPPVDSDGDGTPDFQDTDADNDTIFDLAEGTLDRDNDGTPNYLDLDSDQDGWSDAAEAGDANRNTPPIDSDNDNIPDYLDFDSDADGLADALELGCPVASNRLNPDSDNDGFVDPAEIAFGSNPCNAASIIDDFYFILPPGGPGDNAPLVFSDTDIDSADIAINMDTTGSMGDEIANVQASLSTTIIPGIDAVIPDAAFAVSSFEDYPVEPFGCPPVLFGNCANAPGDLPFRLGTRATTNAATAQAAVNALTLGWGYDLPEAGIESLHQIATGAGTSWTGGTVGPFDPNQGLVAGVADGTIGGVGFRSDSLPIVVHVTDAFSHQDGDYVLVDPAITAVDTPTAEADLAGIGARVVTIANTLLPGDTASEICSGASPRILGRIERPAGTDVDWFVLSGATAGDVVDVETFAIRFGASIDTMVAVYNSTAQLGINDDIPAVTIDSQLSVVLSGTGPYYVAVTTFNDPDFNGTGSQYADVYWLDVSVDGVPYSASVSECRADDANARTGATTLVPFGSATPPASLTACLDGCGAVLEPFSLPYGMAEVTGALVPACAWDQFGGGRPATCGVNQCCTGIAGAGNDPNTDGLCPLTFEIDDNGNGIDQTMVSAIEALVRFSTFTITTTLRTDPNAAIDTTCFIRSIIPVSATRPNTCAPVPVAVDLFPPSPELDSWENVVPGTILEFDVDAINLDSTTGQPCAPATADPQLFRAYIDVVADGVTVVDTRDVIIIVPPLPPNGGN